MSYGKEGFKERMNLSVKNGPDLTTLPISSDKELLDKYWEIYSIPGIQDIYNHLNNALVDSMKTLPGYIPARWEAKIGVKIVDKDDTNVWDLFNFASQGSVQYQDYAKDKGATLLMIENYETGLIWDLYLKNEYIKKGSKMLGWKNSKLVTP
ncbi:glucoamylase family protein [Gottfriedia sp. NPDC056225]|uniref:glucoamylase family protein n=1 Tax=Gottfriedia sp. NPDC056225 TaxID=3345751 RepID=UPI0035DFD39B